MLIKKRNLIIITASCSLMLLAWYRLVTPGRYFKCPGCPGCNILLITIDTLRADHLGCYGYSRNTTPEIDAFAQESVVFENAYSPAPATIPTFRVIMIGDTISNEEEKAVFAYIHQATYLAEILKKRGYRTAFFTDHWALDAAWTFVRGFDLLKNFGEGQSHVSSHRVTEGAAQWIEKHHQDQFFVWAHYFDPHFNYNPLPEFEDMFGYSADHCGRITNGMDIKEIRDIEQDLSPEELACLISLHDAEIFYTDKHVGLLLKKIKDLRLEKNTIIIITSDHGEEFNERSRVGHELTVYNEVIHVPFIVRMPQQPPARIKDAISTVETFKMLSHPDAPCQIPLKPEAISRTYLYHHYRNDKTKNDDFAIIQNNHKYIYNPKKNREELYDLKNDPGEKNNLANNPLSFERQRKLRWKLLEWIDQHTFEGADTPEEALRSEEKIMDRLKSLGYLQ